MVIDYPQVTRFNTKVKSKKESEIWDVIPPQLPRLLPLPQVSTRSDSSSSTSSNRSKLLWQQWRWWVYITQPFQILYNAIESSYLLILPLNIYNFPIQVNVIYLSFQFLPFTQEITQIKKRAIGNPFKIFIIFVYSGFTGYVQQVNGNRKSEQSLLWPACKSQKTRTRW